MFNWDLRVPFLYQNTYITLRNLDSYMTKQGFNRASRRRHLALMHSRKGKLGFGGGWRKTPDPVSPASMRGESFHQDQKFSDGFVGPTAIDYVWIDGPDAGDWHDVVPTNGVPVQGSAEAKLFGIHANVGVPGYSGFESWHGQPVEIDGWGSATDGGKRPAPMIQPDYPLPKEHDPYYEEPSQGDDNMTPIGGIPLKRMDRQYDSRVGNKQISSVPQVTLKKGENRKIPVGMANQVGVRLTVVNSRGYGYVSVTGDPGLGDPTVNMWDGMGGDGVIFVATDAGHVYLATTVECDVILDVFVRS